MDYGTTMLLEQRVSGYWEQTAPKVKRNRGATGESERVSTLLSRHMKSSLLLVCVCGGEMMQWVQRIQVKPNDSRSVSLEKTHTNM